MRYLFTTLWFIGAVTLGVLLDYFWIQHRWQRIRYCESCGSDTTENHTAMVDVCADCYGIYRAGYENLRLNSEQSYSTKEN